LLKIKEINVFYGQAHVLFNVSLTVNKGGLTILIGPNGAGKTTLLKAISGLIKPISGVIEFKGEEITKFPPHEIVKLGISHCPEGRQLFPELSVLDNLKMGAYTQDKKKSESLMEEVFEYFPVLKERIKQKAKTLSGGEQQMLAIGRALMSDPKFLLLDEPSLGLSPILVQSVVKIIKKLHEKSSITILLVEQNAKAALQLADFGYVINTGRIVLKGKTSELIKSEEIKKSYLGL